MRILVVSCLYPPQEPNGGASIYAHTLSKEYSKKNDVYVFAGGINKKNKLYKTTKEKHEGIKITRINLDFESFDQPIRRLLGSKKIKNEFFKILKSFKPDIVHYHSIQGLGVGVIQSAQNLNIKTIITLHDSWWLCPRQFFLKNDKTTFCQEKNIANCSLCYGLLEEKSKIQKNLRKEYEILLRDRLLESVFEGIDFKIFPSKFLYNIYSKHYQSNKNNWLVSQNGVTKPKNVLPKKLNKSTTNFLFVGGGSKEKGANLIIDTWQKYFSENKNIRLNVYGNNINEIANKIFSDNITLYGWYSNSDISKIFAENDVLVFPSIIPENSPITIKEALSYSLPVIASDIGGIPELIKDGKNGLIFKNKSELYLSEKIKKFISKKTVKQFSKYTTNNVHLIEEQLNEILSFIHNRQKPSQKTLSDRNDLISTFNKLFYFSKDNPLINQKIISLWSENRTEKLTSKSLVFNLDHKRMFHFIKNKKVLKKNMNQLIEVHKLNNKLNITEINTNKIEGSKIKVWLQIFKISRKNKVNAIVLPFPNLSSFNLSSKLLCLVFRINTFVTLDKNNLTEHKLCLKIDLSIQNIKLLFSKLLRIVLKIILYIIVTPILILFSLYSLTSTKYGKSRVKKVFDKIYVILKDIFDKILYSPLLAIKKILLFIVNLGIPQ